MNKSLMLSIQPKHLVNILNGNKTLELRKTVPKDYKGWVYIYCTKGKKDILYKYKDSYYHTYILNGKVVARFWFDDYIAYKYYEDDNSYFAKRPQDFGYGAEEVLERLCLSRDEFKAYGKGKDLYAWHIKKLEIFDEPKELSKFYQFKKKWVHSGMDCPPYVDEVKTILIKAPQSWRYVYYAN